MNFAKISTIVLMSALTLCLLGCEPTMHQPERPIATGTSGGRTQGVPQDANQNYPTNTNPPAYQQQPTPPGGPVGSSPDQPNTGK